MGLADGLRQGPRDQLGDLSPRLSRGVQGQGAVQRDAGRARRRPASRHQHRQPGSRHQGRAARDAENRRRAWRRARPLRTRMSDQVVIVTGGSRGIGAATARLLGAEKAAVVVNYRKAKAEADAVVRDIEASGGRAVAVQGDMGNEDDILRLFAETDRAFGPLTGLVNNAGIVGGQKRRIDAITFAGAMEVMRTNLVGPLICAREAIKRMSTK